MTTPCSQEKTLERMENKIDGIAKSIHSIDLRVTRIEVTQEVQKEYVEAKSKRNGQYYGAIFGLITSLLTGLILTWVRTIW